MNKDEDGVDNKIGKIGTCERSGLEETGMRVWSAEAEKKLGKSSKENCGKTQLARDVVRKD
jgi:hypothetical protein